MLQSLRLSHSSLGSANVMLFDNAACGVLVAISSALPSVILNDLTGKTLTWALGETSTI